MDRLVTATLAGAFGVSGSCQLLTRVLFWGVLKIVGPLMVGFLRLPLLCQPKGVHHVEKHSHVPFEIVPASHFGPCLELFPLVG